MSYIWQPLTSNLEHGNYFGIVPLWAHLLGNCLVIGVFGVMVERLLGRCRFWIVSVSALLSHLVFRWILHSNGNGASGIAWAYAPIVAVTILYMYREDAKKLWRDPWTYLSFLLFAAIWIAITVGGILIQAHSMNLFHLLATFVGSIYAWLWRSGIAKRVAQIQRAEQPVRENSSWNRPLLYLHSGIPIFVAVVLILVYSNGFTRHLSPAQAEIYPSGGAVEAVNLNQQITIHFTHPMRQACNQSSFWYDSLTPHTDLQRSLEWIDQQTLLVRFNRPLYLDEKVSILLGGLFDQENRPFRGPIRLQYGR